MTGLRLAAGIIVMLLLLQALSCVLAPVAYHGLSAVTPTPGHIAARVGYHRMHWHLDDSWKKPESYISGGVRIGQDWRGLSFEQGMTMLSPDITRSPPCLQLGIGLRRPALTLRALSMLNRRFDPTHWWQLSLLAGTERQTRGFGFSGGVRASNLALGTMAVLDYHPFPDLSLRLESSLMFPPPWQDETVQGRVLTIGLVADPAGSYRR